MNRGDLRRFKDSVHVPASPAPLCGKTFMVLERARGLQGWDGFVTILVDGMVVGPWGYSWAEQNSEALEPVQPTQ
jgi:hypothetical protein